MSACALASRRSLRRRSNGRAFPFLVVVLVGDGDEPQSEARCEVVPQRWLLPISSAPASTVLPGTDEKRCPPGRGDPRLEHRHRRAAGLEVAGSHQSGEAAADRRDPQPRLLRARRLEPPGVASAASAASEPPTAARAATGLTIRRPPAADRDRATDRRRPAVRAEMRDRQRSGLLENQRGHARDCEGRHAGPGHPDAACPRRFAPWRRPSPDDEHARGHEVGLAASGSVELENRAQQVARLRPSTAPTVTVRYPLAMVPVVVRGSVWSATKTDWQVRQPVSRSTHRCTRPSTASSPCRVICQRSVRDVGSITTLHWLSPVFGSLVRWYAQARSAP